MSVDVITPRLGRLVVAVVLSLFALPITSSADSQFSVSIAWDPPVTNEDSSILADLSGYRIYRSIDIGGRYSNPQLLAEISDSETSYTDNTVNVGTRYQYSLTAINSTDLESDKSSGLSVTIPGLAPTGDDSDGDGISDDQDNCPGISNPDQTNTGGGSVGDVCRERIQRPTCALSVSDTVSSIPVSLNGKSILVNPRTMSAKTFDVAKGTQVVLGDFDSDNDGPDGYGALEVAESKAQSGAMKWEITSGAAVNEVNLSVSRGHSLGCFIDGDQNVDVAGWNSSGFTAIRSNDLSTLYVSFAQFGSVRDVTCADTNGDGMDELVVLYLKSAAARKKSIKASAASLNVAVFDIAAQQLLSKTAVDMKTKKILYADTNGNGAKELCLVKPGTSGRSIISCNRGGPKSLNVPEIKEITSGRYTNGKKNDGFITLGADNKVYMINVKGGKPNLRQVVSKSGGITAKGNRALHLAQCR